MLARRVERIGFSVTLALSDLAGRLRAEGRDVVDFTAGQPDFPTPLRVKEAGKAAIDADRTRYTATSGIVELRRAVAEGLRRERGVEYAVEEILISPGAKYSLYLTFQALVDEGDRVIIPSPYWTSYPEQVRLAGAEPLFVDCPESENFKLSPARLARALDERTRAIVLNYPSNPTGVCYGREELTALGRLCAERGVWIVADEIYSRLLFDGRSFTSVAAVDPAVRERTIVIDGLSKTYAMTGWRIGWAAGPRAVIGAMAKLQSHSTSNATSISQWAGVEALALGRAELDEHVREMQRRRDRMVGGLAALPGVSCVAPDGAFYALPNVAGALARTGLASASELAHELLERALVAVVPGEGFGAPAHLRLSFATSLERIDEGLDRIGQTLASW